MSISDDKGKQRIKSLELNDISDKGDAAPLNEESVGSTELITGSLQTTEEAKTPLEELRAFLPPEDRRAKLKEALYKEVFSRVEREYYDGKRDSPYVDDNEPLPLCDWLMDCEGLTIKRYGELLYQKHMACLKGKEPSSYVDDASTILVSEFLLSFINKSTYFKRFTQPYHNAGNQFVWPLVKPADQLSKPAGPWSSAEYPFSSLFFSQDKVAIFVTADDLEGVLYALVNQLKQSMADEKNDERSEFESDSKPGIALRPITKIFKSYCKGLRVCPVDHVKTDKPGTYYEKSDRLFDSAFLRKLFQGFDWGRFDHYAIADFCGMVHWRSPDYLVDILGCIIKSGQKDFFNFYRPDYEKALQQASELKLLRRAFPEFADKNDYELLEYYYKNSSIAHKRESKLSVFQYSFSELYNLKNPGIMLARQTVDRDKMKRFCLSAIEQCQTLEECQNVLARLNGDSAFRFLRVCDSTIDSERPVSRFRGPDNQPGPKTYADIRVALKERCQEIIERDQIDVRNFKGEYKGMRFHIESLVSYQPNMRGKFVLNSLRLAYQTVVTDPIHQVTRTIPTEEVRRKKDGLSWRIERKREGAPDPSELWNKNRRRYGKLQRQAEKDLKKDPLHGRASSANNSLKSEFDHRYDDPWNHPFGKR